MSKGLKLENFFGLDLEQTRFDPLDLLDRLGLKEVAAKTKSINDLIEENSDRHPIVSIARRQLGLKHIKLLLCQKFLSHDKHFYDKEVNTATDRDRRYGCEDKLIWIAWMFAYGKTKEQILAENPNMSTKSIREDNTRETQRFDRIWTIMTKASQADIDAYRKQKAEQQKAAKGAKENTGKGGFWRRLFS